MTIVLVVATVWVLLLAAFVARQATRRPGPARPHPPLPDRPNPNHWPKAA